MKIKLLNKISPVGLNVFDETYEASDAIENPDAIMVRSAKMHDLPRNPELLAIARAGAGVNNIPVDACSEEGIVVFNTPGANANAVKEMVLTGMLLASRDVIGGVEYVRGLEGQDGVAKLVEANKSNFAGTELQGKTLAVIGLGAIGVLVANAAHSLGMDVIGYDPYVSVNAAWKLSRSIEHGDSLASILPQADFVTIHVPLNDETKQYINQDVFAMMKKGVKLMNFSRGEIVDKEALLKAIEDGIVDKYVTDFPNEKMVNQRNVIAIPHLGASTEESEENCAVMAAQQIRDYLENGNIVNSVNFPASDMGALKLPCRVLIMHRNIPKIVSQLTQLIAHENLNISDMNNRSRKDLAYTMLDLDSKADAATLDAMRAVAGVIRVRVIYK